VKRAAVTIAAVLAAAFALASCGTSTGLRVERPWAPVKVPVQVIGNPYQPGAWLYEDETLDGLVVRGLAGWGVRLAGQSDMSDTPWASASPDGRLVAYATWHGLNAFDLRVADLVTGDDAVIASQESHDPYGRLTGGDPWLFAADWRPDGTLAVLYGEPGSARQWLLVRAPDGRVTQWLSGSRLEAPRWVGKRLLVGSGKRVLVLSGPHAGTSLPLPAATDRIAAFAPDGRRALVLTNMDTFAFVRLQPPRRLERLNLGWTQPHFGPVQWIGSQVLIPMEISSSQGTLGFSGVAILAAIGDTLVPERQLNLEAPIWGPLQIEDRPGGRLWAFVGAQGHGGTFLRGPLLATCDTDALSCTARPAYRDIGVPLGPQREQLRLVSERHRPKPSVIAFWDQSHGVARFACATCRDTIRVTHDGGLTWDAVYSAPRRATITSLAIGGPGSASAVLCLDAACARRRLLMSRDAGRSWTQVGRAPGPLLRVGAGGLAVSLLGGQAWISRDGGRSWQQRGIACPTGDARGLAVTGPSSAIARCRVAGRTMIAVTHDGGRSWQTRTATGAIQKIDGLFPPDAGLAPGDGDVALSVSDGRVLVRSRGGDVYLGPSGADPESTGEGTHAWLAGSTS
jgi:hypothetical protein